MNIDDLIKKYVRFLNISIPSCKEVLSESTQSDELLDNWLQASWESLVESVLFFGSKRFLPVYGHGADLGLASSRVTFPEALPTDRIRCSCVGVVKDFLSGNEIYVEELEFEEFVSWDGKWYSTNNELDCVLLSDDENEYVILMENVSFIVESIE